MRHEALSMPKYWFFSEENKQGIIKKPSILGFSGLDISYETEHIEEAKRNIYKIDKDISVDNIGGTIISLSTSGMLSVNTGVITNDFNIQTVKYINALNYSQDQLSQQTQIFLKQQMEVFDNPTATILRNKSNWNDVKQLVIRDELMKLQIGNETELPFTDTQIIEIRNQIEGKDLSNFSDQELKNVIEDILKPDNKVIMEAFQTFKKEGIINPGFQVSKIEDLSKALDKIDLNKITSKDFRHLVENYWEKIEIHHRTSISSDPTKQSDINNLDALNTTRHDEKHTQINAKGEKKIRYAEPVNEELRDRQGELKILNRKRVLKNEIAGLGTALLIGAGTGFAIGFAVSLAQSGINPNSIKYAFASGAKSGGEGVLLSGINYAVVRTIGLPISESISSIVASCIGETLAEQTMRNIMQMCSMGTVGTLSIVITSVYQFTKLKIMGYSTKESLLRTGKSAAMSFAVLFVSVIAQGIWGGVAGLAVSVSAGIIITGSSVCKMIHDKELRVRIYEYMIELSKPNIFIVQFS